MSILDFTELVDRIGEYTANLHGVQRDKGNFQIRKAGISKLSGKQTLAVPPVLDIFIWLDDEIIPSTPFIYFKTIGRLNGDSYEYWSNEITHLFKEKQAKNGYYIINHCNHTTRYLGVDWNKVCDDLDGQYFTDTPHLTISPTPFTPEFPF